MDKPNEELSPTDYISSSMSSSEEIQKEQDSELSSDYSEEDIGFASDEDPPSNAAITAQKKSRVSQDLGQEETFPKVHLTYGYLNNSRFYKCNYYGHARI